MRQDRLFLKHRTNYPIMVALLVGILGMNIEGERQCRAESADEAARQVIADYMQNVVPLEIAANRAWWDANVSGKDEDFARKVEAENRLDAALSDSERFRKIEAVYKAGPKDPLLARQIELLYLRTREKQLPQALLEKMTRKANTIEKAFNVYRAKVGDRELTDSQVREILKRSRDSEE
ncbi:MAG TPA: peptidase M3, partial [Planctomycetaceae bacterium]|nr:peptidase M3 [Planctomycetaceae bacterium]